eukprot:1725698-Prymnesium_polylepis.2
MAAAAAAQLVQESLAPRLEMEAAAAAAAAIVSQRAGRGTSQRRRPAWLVVSKGVVEVGARGPGGHGLCNEPT